MIGCFERFGALIDWAMLILGPLEPWPGELALGAAAAAGVSVLARVVDYGGLFHDDVSAGARVPRRRPPLVPPRGLGRGGPRADRARCARSRALTGSRCCSSRASGISPTTPVACVAPTLIQESGEGARPIEDKRAELAALPRDQSARARTRSPAIRELGDNTGCMALKGAVPDHAGEDLADRWPLRDEHLEVARRWAIDPARDLVAHAQAPSAA